MPIPYGMGVLSGILPLSNFLEFHAHASQKEFRVPSLFVREFLFFYPSSFSRIDDPE